MRRPYVPCAAFDEHKDVVTGKTTSVSHSGVCVISLDVVLNIINGFWEFTSIVIIILQKIDYRLDTVNSKSFIGKV